MKNPLSVMANPSCNVIPGFAEAAAQAGHIQNLSMKCEITMTRDDNVGKM